MLAFGALTYEGEHGRLELEPLRAQVDQEVGVVGGIENSLKRLERASDRRAALAELLPSGTPDNWVAIGSRPLFDEYERKLREVGTRLDPHLRKEDVPLLRRQMEAVCAIAAPPFADSVVPVLTADPKDDPILYTALSAKADLLISSDKHLVPDRKEELWEHDAGTVLALTLGTPFWPIASAGSIGTGSTAPGCRWPTISPLRKARNETRTRDPFLTIRGREVTPGPLRTQVICRPFRPA